MLVTKVVKNSFSFPKIKLQPLRFRWLVWDYPDNKRQDPNKLLSERPLPHCLPAAQLTSMCPAVRWVGTVSKMQCSSLLTTHSHSLGATAIKSSLRNFSFSTLHVLIQVLHVLFIFFWFSVITFFLKYTIIIKINLTISLSAIMNTDIIGYKICMIFL